MFNGVSLDNFSLKHSIPNLWLLGSESKSEIGIKEILIWNISLQNSIKRTERGKREIVSRKLIKSIWLVQRANS